jgi:hypothetical protein
MSKPVDDFSVVRPIRRLNRLTQVFLAIGLALMVNFLAEQSDFRFRYDLTTDQRHSLSAESVETIKVASRKSPVGNNKNKNWVRALVLNDNFSENDVSLRIQLGKLLEAYKIESSKQGDEWFNVTQVSNGLNQELLSDVAAQNGPPARNTVLIILCGTRVKYISSSELVDISPSNQALFKGESVVTSALLEVTEERPAIGYIIKGHGELGLEDSSPLRGMSQLSRQLRNRNFTLRTLDLTTSKEIPRDTSVLFIMGPQIAFSPLEVELIKTYLYERNGRVLVLLEPAKTHGLDTILSDWAIFSPDCELQEQDPSGRSAEGDIVLRRLVDKPNALTRVLQEQDLPIIGSRFRNVKFDDGSTPDSTLSVTPLIFSSDNSWGETDYQRRPFKYDINRDQPGPLSVAVAAERAAGIRKGTTSSGGRLVVIGSSDIATNQKINRGGNQAFIIQTAAWLADRDRAVSITPRVASAYQITATAADFWALALRFGCIPAIVLALGLAISIWRRRN